MKLYIQYDKSNTSGKGKFLSRLVPEIEKLGIKCNFDDEKHSDVALVVTRFRGQKRPKIPTAVRIDGVHMKRGKGPDYRNKKIAYAINKCDAVIYQSQYCKKMAKKWLKIKNRNEFVIFNGADPDAYRKIEVVKPHNFTVVASAKWCNRNGERQQKRIDRIYNIARQMPEISFWICGQTTTTPHIKCSNITMFGHLPEDNLRSCLAAADCFLYLPTYDWMPNGVVEALCAGLPVITSPGHGASELIEKCSGYIAKDNENAIEYIKEIIEYKDNGYKLTSAYIEPVLIKNIANQYKEVFESCLR